MAQTTTLARPALAQPRAAQALEMVRNAGGSFDVDMWHCINERDDALIADEIAHGPGSAIFVYSFDIAGHPVSGISTKGAQYLAQEYGGLKHRMITALEKRGSIVTYQRFEGEGPPIGCVQLPPEMAGEDDFYSCVVEVLDIKTGNSVQIERRELRQESRRDGSKYDRPNYTTIAQSKARRNGYLVLVPQAVQQQFMQRMLALPRHHVDLTPSLIDEKRSGVMRFAAQQGLAVDRRAIEHLDMNQITGLGDAARQGAPAFVNAARGLGLEISLGEEAAQETGRAAPDASQPPAAAGSAGPSQAARRGRPPGPRRQEEPPPVEDERAFGEPEPQPEEQRPPPARQVDFDV